MIMPQSDQRNPERAYAFAMLDVWAQWQREVIRPAERWLAREAKAAGLTDDEIIATLMGGK